MKLLFDENLSPRLVTLLARAYPQSQHVDAVGLHGKGDREIWAYAAANGFTIVSKDNDFRQMSFLSGHPPKVIWLSVGNVGTEMIGHLLLRRQSQIEQFSGSREESLFVLEGNQVS